MRTSIAAGPVMEDVDCGYKKTGVLSMTKRKGGALIIAPKVGRKNSVKRTGKE